MLLVSSASFAQSAGSASAARQNAAKTAPATNAPSSQKAATAPSQKLKKDGTPDMRYKENKKANTAKPSAPAKKA